MKYCTNCGAACDDSAACCGRCGSRFAAPSIDVSQATGTQSNNVIQAIKSCGKSPLFIVFTAFVVLSTLLILASIVDYVMYYDYYDMINIYGLDGYSATMIVSNSISAIMMLLTSLALILIMTSAMRKANTMSTAGLTILRVLMIIELIAIIILFIVALIICAVILIVQGAFLSEIYNFFGTFINYGTYNETSVRAIIIAVMAVVLIVIITIAVLSIIFVVKVMKSLKLVSQAIRTGTANKGPSMYIAVILIALGACNLLGLVSQIVDCITSGTTTSLELVFAIISMFLSVGIQVCGAIIIIQYRSKMRRLMYGTYIPVAQPITPTPQVVVNTTPRCPSCGMYLEVGSTFCSGCGQKL